MLLNFLVYSFLLFFMVFMGWRISHRYCFYSNSEKVVLYRRKMALMPLSFGVMFLVYSFFAGYRYDVGVDHLSYLDNYIYGNRWGIEFEFLYQKIIDICKGAGLNFAMYFFVVAFLQISLYYNAFKREAYIYPFLSFFFLCNGEWGNFNNIIRCMLAAVIWLNALQFVYKQQFVYYLLSIIVAALFHKSAIILIVLYPFFWNSKDYFKSVLSQLIVLVVALFIRMVFVKYGVYLENVVNLFSSSLGYKSYELDSMLQEANRNVEGTGFAYVFKIICNVVIILQSRKIKEFYSFNKRFVIFYNLFVVGVLFFGYIFPEGIIGLSRPFRYFYLFQNIMFAFYAYYLLKNRTWLNTTLLIMLLLGFTIIFYYGVLSAKLGNHFFYQFCFDYLR